MGIFLSLTSLSIFTPLMTSSLRATIKIHVPPCVPLCRMAHPAVQGCLVSAAGVSPCGHFCPTDSSDGGRFVQQPPLCSGSHHWQRSLPAYQHTKCLPVLCRVSLRSVGSQQLMTLGPLFRSDLVAHPPQMIPQTHWVLTLLSPQPRSPHNHFILHQDVSSAGMSLLEA